VAHRLKSTECEAEGKTKAEAIMSKVKASGSDAEADIEAIECYDHLLMDVPAR